MAERQHNPVNCKAEEQAEAMVRRSERQRIQEVLEDLAADFEAGGAAERANDEPGVPSSVYFDCAGKLRAALGTLDPSGERQTDQEKALEGLPSDLATVLQEPGVFVPQDSAVFRMLAEWNNAPSNTESADLHPSGEQGEESKQERIEALEERLGDAEAQLDKWEPVLVAADRVSSAYAAALAGRDLGGLPQWEKGEDGQLVNGRRDAPAPATDTSKERNCISCSEEEGGKCPKSKRPCGHHCNCSYDRLVTQEQAFAIRAACPVHGPTPKNKEGR